MRGNIDFTMIFFGIIFSIGFLIWSIVRIVKRRGKLKESIGEFNLNINLYNEQVQDLSVSVEKQKQIVIEDKKSLNNQKNKIKELKAKISTDKVNLNKLIEYNKNLTNKNMDSITVESNQSKVLTEALQNKYNYLITQADWANIDLLIFYLQTGRADTLKEALQQADRQRQTDSIVNELKHATSAISSTINAGFGRLATAMGRCFSQLSYQINEYTQQIGAYTQQVIGAIENLHTNINSNYAQIIANNKEVVNEQKLQTALLEKANKSSDDLMNELRYQQKYWVK
jgi:hypothetical protein